MARFLFVWTIMIGAMLGVRESTHFEVDVWPRLSRRVEAAVRLVARLGVLVVALVFVWSGIEFTRFAWYRISELAELPLWLIHIAWPITGFTWLVFLGEQMWDEFAHPDRSRSGRCAPELSRRRPSGGSDDRRRAHAGQAALILFGLFFLLLFLRVPVAFALALACLPMLPSSRGSRP